MLHVVESFQVRTRWSFDRYVWDTRSLVAGVLRVQLARRKLHCNLVLEHVFFLGDEEVELAGAGAVLLRLKSYLSFHKGLVDPRAL